MKNKRFITAGEAVGFLIVGLLVISFLSYTCIQYFVFKECSYGSIHSYFMEFGAVGLTGWFSLGILVILAPLTVVNKNSRESPDLFYGITRGIYCYFMMATVCSPLAASYTCDGNWLLRVQMHTYCIIDAGFAFLISSFLCLFCVCFVVFMTRKKPQLSLISTIGLVIMVVDILLFPLLELSICVIDKL